MWVVEPTFSNFHMMLQFSLTPPLSIQETLSNVRLHKDSKLLVNGLEEGRRKKFTKTISLEIQKT